MAGWIYARTVGESWQCRVVAMPEVIDAGPVRLERWRPELAPGLAAAFAASERAVRAWMPSAAGEQEDAPAFVDWCVAAFDAETSYAYAVIDGDEVVGYCNLTPDGDVAVVAYWIRSDRVGAGLATGVVRALAQAAFAGIDGVRRIRAHIDAANGASRRVLEKVGFEVTRSVDRPARTSAESAIELELELPRVDAT